MENINTISVNIKDLEISTARYPFYSNIDIKNATLKERKRISAILIDFGITNIKFDSLCVIELEIKYGTSILQKAINWGEVV